MRNIEMSEILDKNVSQTRDVWFETDEAERKHGETISYKTYQYKITK